MKAAEIFFVGFFAVIGLAIVFVQAGSKGGGANQSGGTQAGSIIGALGNALTSVGTGLETGNK